MHKAAAISVRTLLPQDITESSPWTLAGVDSVYHTGSELKEF